MNGCAVSQTVWMKTLVTEGGLELGSLPNIFFQYQPDSEARQQCAAMIEEQGNGGIGQLTPFFKQLRQQFGGFRPQRTDSLLAAFAMKQNTGRRSQPQISN